mmetsp:Transcript_67469/g.75574  ORF Transcript_67469/g.75574 Transcript_67469/m.75574 type:complete len:115 (-) Transcript_67469:153-497(-)
MLSRKREDLLSIYYRRQGMINEVKNDHDQHQKKEGNPKKYIGQRVAKYFEMPHPENVNQIKKDLYLGTIDSISDPLNLLWHVRYDDGDEEEYDFRELRAGILLYAKEKGPDKPS